MPSGPAPVTVIPPSASSGPSSRFSLTVTETVKLPASTREPVCGVVSRTLGEVVSTMNGRKAFGSFGFDSLPETSMIRIRATLYPESSAVPSMPSGPTSNGLSGKGTDGVTTKFP